VTSTGRWGRGAAQDTQLYDYDPLRDELPQVKPYTVLNTTTAQWLNRRGQWARLGIRGEVKGRQEALLFGNQEQLLSYDVACGTCGRTPPLPPRTERQGTSLFDVAPVLTTNPKAGEQCPRSGCGGTYVTKPRGQFSALEAGTSIFDPVLCELLYRWYCPPGGLVLDPFAGGAVRGVVAWKLGRRYVGVELRGEQVADNNAQCRENGWGAGPFPQWRQGDSAQELQPPPPPYAPSSLHIMGPYDFVLTCPPYYDAEVYSDDPADLSAAPDHASFQAAYADILGKACRLLAPDRYVAVVVAEARGKDGAEYGLVQDTCVALRAAGLVQQAHYILVNPLGTLPLRMGKQWAASRAPGRHHQHVLVYRKGDRKEAVAALEPMTLFDAPEPEVVPARPGSKVAAPATHVDGGAMSESANTGGGVQGGAPADAGTVGAPAGAPGDASTVGTPAGAPADAAGAGAGGGGGTPSEEQRNANLERGAEEAAAVAETSRRSVTEDRGETK
jgi:hypothetical protein